MFANLYKNSSAKAIGLPNLSASPNRCQILLERLPSDFCRPIQPISSASVSVGCVAIKNLKEYPQSLSDAPYTQGERKQTHTHHYCCKTLENWYKFRDVRESLQKFIRQGDRLT